MAAVWLMAERERLIITRGIRSIDEMPNEMSKLPHNNVGNSGTNQINKESNAIIT